MLEGELLVAGQAVQVDCIGFGEGMFGVGMRWGLGIARIGFAVLGMGSAGVTVRRELDHMVVASIDYVEVADIQHLGQIDTGDTRLLDLDREKTYLGLEWGLWPMEVGIEDGSQEPRRS